MSKIYTDEFFDECRDINYPNAKNIIPLIKDFLCPRTIIDFGCGVGCWLKVFDEEFELDDYLGLDGEWLMGKKLLVPEEKIRYINLSQPINLEGKWDLAVSLEVAEHIEQKYTDIYLNNITNSSDVILFSAAIPQQGGTGHVNERWQSYWFDEFAKKNFVGIDCLRPLIWNNAEAGIYRQNILFFVKKDRLDDYPELKEKYSPNVMLDVVHPMLYSEHKVARKFIAENNKNIELSKKYIELFNIMAMWMEKEVSEYKLCDWLESKSITECAVYGMGDLGKTLVKYLKANSIKVKYAIDRGKDGTIDGINIYHMKCNTDLPYIKTIIVTVPHDFDSIIDELNLRLDNVEIINFAEIIKLL